MDSAGHRLCEPVVTYSMGFDGSEIIGSVMAHFRSTLRHNPPLRTRFVTYQDVKTTYEHGVLMRTTWKGVYVFLVTLPVGM